jgi:predicted acetyltransferase
MNTITLVFPNEVLESEALNFKRDFFQNDEKIINGSYKLDQDKYTYSDWLAIIRNNLDSGKANPKFGFMII